MSAAAVVKTALWTWKLKTTMHGHAHDLEGVKFYCDIQAALALMKNPVHHQRVKDIDVCHHFIVRANLARQFTNINNKIVRR